MSAVPDRLEKSGLGDVEAQLRWRWAEENELRPGLSGSGTADPG